ncbi:MAG: DUF192 domain-containing protein [Vicinamibacterales bacterium]
MATSAPPTSGRRALPRTRVVDETVGRLLAVASLASTPLTRMVGLLRHTSLAEGEGLVLQPCSSIHTCFMRFPIDVAFVAVDGTVLHQVASMKPFRLTWAAGAALAVELPAGTLGAHGVERGHSLRFERL